MMLDLLNDDRLPDAVAAAIVLLFVIVLAVGALTASILIGQAL